MSRLVFREEAHEWSDSSEGGIEYPMKHIPADMSILDVISSPDRADSPPFEPPGYSSNQPIYIPSSEEDSPPKKKKQLSPKREKPKMVPTEPQPTPTPQADTAEEQKPRQPASESNLSSFIKRFLATRRSKVDVPCPETVPLNDEILLNFANEYKQSRHVETAVSSDSDSEPEIPTFASKNMPFGGESDQENDESGGKHEENDDSDAPNDFVSTTPHLFLTNLPYVLSERELELDLAILGVETSGLKLHLDKTTGRCSGTAEVTLDPGISPQEALIKLQGRSIGKRTVFAALYKARPSRPLSSSGRYYLRNIHVKCVKCGQVGHAGSHCSNAALPSPCYLCAGTDHVDWECPNIVCFNCGGFGHHSRSCKKPALGKVRICTRCGSTRHDRAHCDTRGAPIEQDVKFARCVMCGQYGHLNCKEKEEKEEKEDTVYCFNCGESGHNTDQLGAGGGCTAPKPEAFVKYPDLTRAYYSGAGRSVLRDMMKQIRQENPSLFYDGGDGRYDDRRHSDGYGQGHRSAAAQRDRKSYGGTERDARESAGDSGNGKKRKRDDSAKESDDHQYHRSRRPYSSGGAGYEGNDDRRQNGRHSYSNSHSHGDNYKRSHHKNR